MEIHFTFYMILSAIGKLFIVMFIGYFLYHKKFIDDSFTDKLSLLLVYIMFPALIISKTTAHFDFKEYAYWWFLPLGAIIFSLTGMAIGGLVHKLMRREKFLKEFMCACAFQNCGYLPMNLIIFSFAGEIADRLLVYLFLFILGFNVLMWSLVPLFLSGDFKKFFKKEILFNPPVCAAVFSLCWVGFAGKGSLPSFVAVPIRQLGEAAFPVAMITLGAYLSRYEAHNFQDKKLLSACVAIKLLVFPLIVLIMLKYAPIPFSYKFFLFLQGVMPSAVSLVVIGSYSKADNGFFSSSIFYTHLFAIFSIPLCLSVFSFLNK